MSTDTENAESSQFAWTSFYETFADRLLVYKDTREQLIGGIHAIARENPNLPMIRLQDRFGDGSEAPFSDMCPFTTMGIFNRGIKDENRKALAKLLADFLGVEVPVPESFDGIPVLRNETSHFFSFAETREPDAFDSLWEIFAVAFRFAKSDNDPDIRASFAKAFDRAAQLKQVSWNLTMGLYWMRPRSYQNLDSRSREYLTKIGIPFKNSVKSNADEYLTLLNTLKVKFQEQDLPVHSYQELSLAAWLGDSDVVPTPPPDPHPEPPIEPKPNQAYAIDSILSDGCFLERSKIRGILERLRNKKNLILQGPPGTGKTWLARRLGYALIGTKDETKVRAVQFHPNLSYEDFVRGWRPSGDGQLKLVDGPLMEMIEAAESDPDNEYVMVVEEINRGNPAQIFGEMLTLLEADKRKPSEALALTYGNERVYVPDNLYLIGTMNLADRSLALVDFALRRRFAFVTLEPTFGNRWSDWVQEQCGIAPDALVTIRDRLNTLNRALSNDANLGPQFQIGHSFVTPSANSKISNAQEWFRHVVETEIFPLLEEYWFDSRDTAQQERDRLLEGF